MHMPDHERATLKYVSGTTIHKVTKDLCESAKSNMINQIHKARIEYKCYQLMQSLRIPEGFALEYTDDLASLKEILRRQHNSRGLTIVSDQAFMFFKYMYCKMKSIQTFEYLEKHRTEMLYHTKIQLKCDEKLKISWHVVLIIQQS